MTCPICAREFVPCKPTSKTCSRRCANTLTARETAAARAAKQRDRGEGKTYRRLYGRHEHRVVAEQMLGRPLRPGEVVHHINGDKRDNRPENLQVLASQAEHARLHSTKDRRCEVDGCERKHTSRGMCGMHYQRQRARESGVPEQKVGRSTCTVVDCGRPINAKGLCNRHYKQARSGKGVTP